MKKNIKFSLLIYATFLLSFSCFAHVSKKDIRLQKLKYISEKKSDIRKIDSLTYLGLRAIRHDQKIPFFLRKRN